MIAKIQFLEVEFHVTAVLGTTELTAASNYWFKYRYSSDAEKSKNSSITF
jgi:hypothetical protein